MYDINELNSASQVHFIGIGGISMSGLAMIMLDRGYKVTGSDRARSPITELLELNGATVFEGHAGENIEGSDLVVYTAAVKGDNPEIIAAKEKNIRLIDRAEFLGAIMKSYPVAVCVAGTHGKTTTTSLLTHAMISAECDPTVSIGGQLPAIGGNIRVGKSDYFLTEACEYTNSFLKFYPKVAVITNIEEDHLDFFSGLDEIKESFAAFAALTVPNGAVVACGDDENVRAALGNPELDIYYYGFSAGCSYRAENITKVNGKPSFDITYNGEFLCNVTLRVSGEHNILNTLATIAVCHRLGLDISLAKDGVEEFTGTTRRFEHRGTVNGAEIYDDYAHHPTEIKATLKAASDMPHNRLIIAFQPHTYSRTRTLWNEFLNCFDLADELILADIYAARELPDGVTTSEKLAEALSGKGVKVKYISDFAEIEDYIKTNAREGDLIFTMGAGNIVNIADKLTK